MREYKNILFVGGGSEIALKMLSDLKKYNISSLSRNYQKNYNKNYIINTYSNPELSTALKKINKKFNLILIFNGIFEFSTLSALNEKKFYNTMNVNVVTPIRVINKLLEYDLLEKNTNIFFLSSKASIKPEIGNAYYSISKSALNFSIKILQKENRKRFIKFNLIRLGLVENKMGKKAQNLIKLKKNYNKKIKNTGYLNLIKYLKIVIKNPKKAKSNIVIN